MCDTIDELLVSIGKKKKRHTSSHNCRLVLYDIATAYPRRKSPLNERWPFHCPPGIFLRHRQTRKSLSKGYRYGRDVLTLPPSLRHSSSTITMSSENSYNGFANDLQASLPPLLDFGKHSDLIIKCEGDTHTVHKVFMCAHSTWFTKACEGGFEVSISLGSGYSKERGYNTEI